MNDFYVYLTAQKDKEKRSADGSEKSFKKNKKAKRLGLLYKWLEILLQIGIEDYLKHALPIIIATYLIGVRRLPCKEAYRILKGG